MTFLEDYCLGMRNNRIYCEGNLLLGDVIPAESTIGYPDMR